MNALERLLCAVGLHGWMWGYRPWVGDAGPEEVPARRKHEVHHNRRLCERCLLLQRRIYGTDTWEAV